MRSEPEGSTTSPNLSELSVSPNVQNCFTAVDSDNSGKINSKDLKCALINAQGQTFSDEACKLMINLFDKDKSGTIDVNEFQHLYTYVNQWTEVFRAYDKDNSGYIDDSELEQLMLRQMGYRLLSNNFVQVLLVKSCKDNVKRMSFDQFIVACVKIQRLTNAFSMRDKNMEGVVTFGFEEFLEIVLEVFL